MKKIMPIAITVAIITLVSQILGYIRELLFAYYLGTSTSLEAFQVAETVPLLFTQILISSVPLALTPLIIKEEKDDSCLQNAVLLFTTITLALVFLIFFAPQVFINIMAPGFRGSKYLITCRLVTILAPNILFLSLVSIFTSFLNSKNQFIIPSIALLFLNASTIVMQLLTKANVTYVAIGSVIGSIIAFTLVTIVSVTKYSYKPHLSKVSKKTIFVIIKALLPVCIVSSFSSLNLIFDKNFASQLKEGSVAILTYSYKIINLPVYLFITSITKVILPSVTGFINKKQYKQLSIIIRKVLLFTIVIGVILIILILSFSKYFVTLVLGRGAFNATDIMLTADALKFYSLGIIGLALNSFFQSISYAEGRYYKPLLIYLIQLTVYLAVTKCLINTLQVQAIILGNVISVTVSIFIWLIILNKSYINKEHKNKLFKNWVKYEKNT